MTDRTDISVEALLSEAQKFIDEWFNNPGTARPEITIPAQETNTDIALIKGISDLSARLADVEAALDSIEAKGSITTGGNVWRFWRDQAREMAASADAAEARAKAAEAKLAKAVKSLQSIKMTHLGDGTWRDLARRREKMASDTLAEIGDKTDD